MYATVGLARRDVRVEEAPVSTLEDVLGAIVVRLALDGSAPCPICEGRLRPLRGVRAAVCCDDCGCELESDEPVGHARAAA